MGRARQLMFCSKACHIFLQRFGHHVSVVLCVGAALSIAAAVGRGTRNSDKRDKTVVKRMVRRKWPTAPHAQLSICHFLPYVGTWRCPPSSICRTHLVVAPRASSTSLVAFLFLRLRLGLGVPARPLSGLRPCSNADLTRPCHPNRISLCNLWASRKPLDHDALLTWVCVRCVLRREAA